MADRRRVPTRSTVTMRDVARHANVSQSTVSRVLSGSDDLIQIGEETRRRVLETVEKLGYHPNLHAGSLRGKKTRMLAMMIADIANPFYHPLVRAVQDVASTHNYDVMVANSDHLVQREDQFLQSVLRRPVDGVIAVPYHLEDGDFEQLIDRTGAQVAVVGQHIRHPLVDVCFSDDSRAIREAVAWLHTAKQHQRIGFIGTPEMHRAGARRRAAFEQGLRELGLQPYAEYEQLGDWSVETGRDAMHRLLALPQPPTAVLACNDLMAIGALEAAQERGCSVPSEVAVVGFDDIPACVWVRPHLTTIAQYPAEMGRLLANALFERIEGAYDGPARYLEVPCRFVERSST